jgi:hypothetical protein
MLIKNDHDRPGVVPGRYAGEAIPIHDGPTPQSIADEEQRRRADGLAGRISAAAADAARSEYQLLELLGEFDAMNAIRYWNDFKSLAHWLSRACSMTPGVAREHVRVAKALRRMPRIAELFRDGRLSYSKVREVTRVVDVVDETRLAQLALTATASQLARMISGFRSADGARISQQTKRQVAWHEREDGMIDFRARPPKEEAAVLLAAMEAAKDQFGPPPPKPDPCGDAGQQSAPGVGTYGNIDALDMARCFLATAPEDRSGEDRTLVVVHVSAETRPQIFRTFQRERRTLLRERLSRLRRCVTLRGSVRLRLLLRNGWPVTIGCSVRSSTGMARCWRSVAVVG